MAPQYPNQQLRAVSLETYFRGRLAAVSRLEQVQTRFEQELPNLFVPHVQPGEAPALRPYQLRPDDQHESLAVSVNQATYVSFAYPGHDEFIQRALHFLVPTLEALGVAELTRVVYRYDNEVILGRDEGGAVPIGRVLKVCAPDGDLESAKSVDLQWDRPLPHGVQGGRVWTATEGGGLDVLRFELHAECEPGGSVGALRETAKRAHDDAVSMFEGMIAPGFRAMISAEATEGLQ